MTGIDRLIRAYNIADSDRIDKDLLSCILQNLRQVGSMNIYDLAEKSYSSTASISRLVKRLGYKNYHYFQKDIADCVEKYEFHNRFLPREVMEEGCALDAVFYSTVISLVEKLRDSMDIQQMCCLATELHAHHHIVFYLFDELCATHMLQFNLFMDGKWCELFDDPADIRRHAETLKEDDFVLVFASSQIIGEKADDLMQTVQSVGALSCFVTDSPHYAARKKADYQFVLPGVLSAVDLLQMELFLYLLALEYRRLFCE